MSGISSSVGIDNAFPEPQSNRHDQYGPPVLSFPPRLIRPKEFIVAVKPDTDGAYARSITAARAAGGTIVDEFETLNASTMLNPNLFLTYSLDVFSRIGRYRRPESPNLAHR